MSFTIENIGALDRLKARFQMLIAPDATDLMVSWMQLIKDDNRRGVLAGLNKDGNLMAPVTYRPAIPKWDTRINIRAKSSAKFRNNQDPRKMHDLKFAGFGVHPAGLNNNLDSYQYRRLTGPPLAPREQFSRVITNLLTAYMPLKPDGRNYWTAWGYWDEVVDEDGNPFLHYHFDGGSNLPVRDLRGVRPEGVMEARNSARAWMIDQVRSNPA